MAAMALVTDGALSTLFADVAGSKLVWGVASVLINLGSRFIIMDMTPAQQKVFGHPIFKRVVIFSLIFMTTRDILLSAALATGVIIVLEGLLNEHSQFCALPASMCGPQTAAHTPMTPLLPGTALFHRGGQLARALHPSMPQI